MASIRQSKIEGVVQQELSLYLQRNAREVCLGAMVSVTQVRITADFSIARCYLSIFAHPNKQEVIENIQLNASTIRKVLGGRLKHMRKIPEFVYYIDDSSDYAQEINDLLKL